MIQIYSFCTKYLIFPILVRGCENNTIESACKQVFIISFIFAFNSKSIFFQLVHMFNYVDRCHQLFTCIQELINLR